MSGKIDYSFCLCAKIIGREGVAITSMGFFPLDFCFSSVFNVSEKNKQIGVSFHGVVLGQWKKGSSLCLC